MASDHKSTPSAGTDAVSNVRNQGAWSRSLDKASQLIVLNPMIVPVVYVASRKGARLCYHGSFL